MPQSSIPSLTLHSMCINYAPQASGVYQHSPLMTLLHKMSVNDWYTFGDKIRGNYTTYPHITCINGKSNSQVSKLAVYLHINYLHLQAPQLSETTSPTEKSFCVIEYAKTNSCTSVQRVTWLLSVGLRKGTRVRASSITGYWWTDIQNYCSYRNNWQEHVRKGTGCAGLQTGHLSGHEWRSHWASFRVCKTFRVCHSSGTSYNCIAVILTLVH
jgi:hypothetical protein